MISVMPNLPKTGFIYYNKNTFHLKEHFIMDNSHNLSLKLNRPVFYPLYAALITVILYTIILLFCHIAGMDNNTILSGDLYQQYIAFIRLFLDSLTSGNSLDYSFSLFLGHSTVSTYAYYCISPFNFLYLIPGFSFSAMTIVIIVAKHALSAFTFQLFLQKTLRKNAFWSILFSVSYALCCFSVAMQMHIMWLDALYILPVLIIFLVRFAEGNSGLPLIPAYAYLFLTNFYMGYIVGIFTALCFIGLLFLKKRSVSSRFRMLLSFLLYVVLAAGCCAAVLLPAASDLLQDRHGDTSGFHLFSITLPDVVNNLFLGEMQSLGSPIPLIYCGLPVLLLLPVYFLSQTVSRREKTVISVIFIIYAASTQFLPVYMFFHAFDAPNWFAHRYAFCCVFLLLSIACKAVPELSDFSHKKMLIYIFVLLLFYSVMIPIQALELTGYSTNSQGWFLINAFFLSGYAACIFVYQQKRHLRILLPAVSLLLCLELVINGCIAVNRNNFGYHPESEINDWENRQSAAITTLKASDPDLYRIRTVGEPSFNAPSYFHYPGVNSFATTDPLKVRELLSSLGIAAPFMCIYDQGYTPVTEMLLGIRYAVDLEDSSAAVTRTKYSLPIAFSVPTGILSYSAGSNPFQNQESLVNALSNGDYHLFSTINPDELAISARNMQVFQMDGQIIWQHLSEKTFNGIVQYTYPVNDNRKLYCWIPTGNVSTLDQSAPVIQGQSSPFSLASYIPIQAITEGIPAEDGSSDISLLFSAGPNFDYTVKDIFFTLYDDTQLEQVYQDLSALPFRIDHWNDGYIKGTATTTEDRPILFTTIPYDKGWTIYADGQLVPSGVVLDGTFLAVALSPGTHTVEFIYEAPLHTAGCLISAACCIISLILLYLRSKKNAKTSIKTEEGSL